MSPSRTVKPKPATFDWLSIAQFCLGAIGISLTWMLALAVLVGSMVQSAQDGLQLFSSLTELIPVGGLFAIGALLVPSTLYSLRRILGFAPSPFKITGRRLSLAIFTFPLLLASGTWAVEAGWGWLVLVTHLLAALVLVAWLLWIGLRGLAPGSAQRAWGAFGAGLAATPVLAFILEAIGVLALIVVFALYVEGKPALAQAVDALQHATSQNPEVLVQSLEPFFADPFVVFALFVSLSILVPLIEELLKPLGVYLLLRRDLTEAQGFALGALCGAGYALVENLTLNTQPETLFLVAVGRFGATAMHIFTGALSGYALARARRSKRWLPLLGILATNIALHGLWNGMVLLITVASVGSLVPGELAIAALPVLLIVALGCVLLLYRINRRLNTLKPKARSL